MAVNNEKLNAKQIAFCELYAESGNGSQSAIKAGYSQKSSRSIAYELLTKPHIQHYIKQLVDERLEEQRKHFLRDAEIAIAALREVAQNGRVEMARVTAANSILDRAGHTTLQRIQSDIKADVKADLNLSGDATFTIKIPNSKQSLDNDGDDSSTDS